MKKHILIILLLAAGLFSAGCASVNQEAKTEKKPQFSRILGSPHTVKGIIPDVGFTPFQFSLIESDKCQFFDSDAFSIFTLGMISAWQRSSVISTTVTISSIYDNYFLQLSGLSSSSSNNYGMAASILNLSDRNYGLQVGAGNFSANKYGAQIGLVNIRGFFQIGLINQTSRGLQIGLLNHNDHALINLMPLFNVSFIPLPKETGKRIIKLFSDEEDQSSGEKK